jgi:sialate O-acetylesterase
MSIELASLFQNHAVIQHGSPVPVWGWADPGSTVRVTLGSHVAVAIAGTHGDFLVRMPPVPVGGPYILVVSIDGTDERIEINDILAGEVWLASGQSNMEMTLNSSRPLTDHDIATADFPEIRFFKVSNRAHLGPQRTVSGSWQSATPAIAGSFSGAAFSFARRIHRELGVPVGIVSSSWGGSIIQSWLSRSSLALNPDTADWLARYESEVWTEARWQKMLSPGPDGRVNGTPRDPGNSGLDHGWHQPGFDDSDWAVMPLPGNWQSAGHQHSGVFWFRRAITIPPAWIGQSLILRFGGADKQDISYVNGIEVGRTGKDAEDQYWNTPRTYAIPASAVSGTSLLVAIRVYSFIYDGGITGAGDALRIERADVPGDSRPLAGEWRYRCEHNLGLVSDTHLMGHGERNSPHILFDNMLLPLVPYAMRGAIWYQGEGNATEARLYARLMRDLIEDWRRQWGQPDFAFHLVQLPAFMAGSTHQSDSHWAHLREAQAAALSLPHTGMAVTIDVGDPDDIHPKNKIPVGERLAQSALVLTYGREGLPCGPLADGFTLEADAMRCHFLHAGEGLTTLDGREPQPFVLAGEDRVFYPAQAQLDGSTVIVRSAHVARPVAVRFAWADNPAAYNLAGPDGLPAGPFRSDRW